MKLFRKETISISLIILVQVVYGQDNYLPGYIVKLNKDTAKGFIDYRNWTVNPNRIYFKETLSGDRIKYQPLSIKSFGVSNEIYEGAIVKREIDYPNEFSKQVELKTDTTFLQAIIRGPKSLYFYLPSIGREQFYIKQDSVFEFLTHKKYQKESPSGKVATENNFYYGQLLIYLKDCPIIQTEMKYVKYSKKSLEDLFLIYYKKCTDIEIKFHKESEKIEIKVGLLGGPTLNALKFTGEVAYNSYLSNTNYEPVITFSGGVFLEAILPRSQKKWSVCTELLFTSYKFNGTSIEPLDPATPDLYVTTNTTLGLSYIKWNNMLRFKYPVGRFHIFTDGGFSVGQVINSINYKTSKLSTSTTTQEGNAIDGIRSLEIGYILGFGTKFKKCSFEIRYEKGNGMSNYVNLKSATTRFYFLLGYRLGH